MAAGAYKTACGHEIRNILLEYEGQISSDSYIEGDSSSKHVDDIEFSEAIVSEIDFEVEDEGTSVFKWEIKYNYVGQ
jgi:hypothetical protein